MLNSPNLNDKSYEELLAEAIAQIPLYSKEWTNFNVSDPGITVLENLTAFNLLQQTRINEVTDEIRRAMLKLLGHTPRESRSATLLLQAPAGEETVTLPAQYQLRMGSLCFETGETTVLDPWSLKRVYAAAAGGYRDVTYLMDPKVGAAAVFGQQPEAGNSLCLILEGTPREGSTLRLWLQAAGEERRNPFPAEGGPVFGRTRWQYYTAQGWQDARAEDETRGLLVSGCVTLTLSAGAPVPFEQTPVQGCALRCVLVGGAYDRVPRLTTLAANLFPVEQRESKSRGYLFQGSAQVRVDSALAAQGYLFVYCREKSGAPYRRYQPYAGVGEKGRYYLLEEREDGVTIRFDRKRFGFGPGQGWGAVRVVCCDGEMVHHRDLGTVYGYENQMIPLNVDREILTEEFSLLAESPGADGEPEYRFISPDNTDPDRLCYTVLPQERAVCIRHPGVGQEYRLFLCDCVVTDGGTGNVHRDGVLIHREGRPGLERETVFTNPAPGRGGQSWEDPEALRRRFSASMQRVTTAVLPSDYETLALQTPGLCIHKVKAQTNPAENLVKIAVKPYTEEKYPKLSPEYLAQIGAYLDAHRLLTTRIELLQPQYVPIHVSAVLYVKRHYQRVREDVEELLRRLLDHVDGPEGFGGWVRFNEVYQQLSALPCVAAVDALRLTPGVSEGAVLVGTDIALSEESLCCPGSFQMEFHNDVQRYR